jgi:hypothetical protein
MEVGIDINDDDLFNAVEGDVLNLIEQNNDITDGLLDALQEYLNQDQDAPCDLGLAFEAAVRKAVYAVLKGA